MSKVIYAIGDIHGCWSLLVSLQDRIAQDIKERGYTDITVVYLGDYVDRGPNTKDVIQRLIESPFRWNLDIKEVHLKGNHEEAMLEALLDPEIHPSWWWSIGGRAVVDSYGVETTRDDTAEEIAAKTARLKAEMPLEHLKFLTVRLNHCYRDSVGGKDYFFCHAGVRPGIPLSQQTTDDLLWIRRDFIPSEFDYGAIIVHGHTISKEPALWPNRIGVDTGAYKYKKLTAVALDDTGTPRFVYAFE